MNKKKILIIGSVALIVVALLLTLIFVINKYTSIPVSTYNNIDNSVINDSIDDDLNEEENIDNEIIDNEDDPITGNTNQSIDNGSDDNVTITDTDKPSGSDNNSSDKNDSTTSTTKPETPDSSDNVTDNEDQQAPTEEPEDNIPEQIKYYTSWGLETTAPKYNSLETCRNAGEEIRLTSKQEDGFYEIGSVMCDAVYDSRKSSRNLLGYNIVQIMCVDYVYNDDGTRTQVNSDCTNKYLK